MVFSFLFFIFFLKKKFKNVSITKKVGIRNVMTISLTKVILYYLQGFSPVS